MKDQDNEDLNEASNSSELESVEEKKSTSMGLTLFEKSFELALKIPGPFVN